VFFDGRLWHGTHNVSDRTRRALLLQYAQPRTAIRIPDLRHLDWPFRLLDRPRPPCIVVHGHADAAVNRIVPAPPTGGAGRPLTSQIHRLRLPLRTDVKTGWRPHPVFSGRTTEVPELACHASTLLPGRSPHLPHAHPEEELLLVLAGEVELELPAAGTVRLRPGELVYYPAGFAHTLRTASVEPSTYVMLKWREEPVDEGATLPFGRFATDVPGVLFEGPTSCLRKLHAHVTVLEPGGGYEPHADAYDVVVVVLEGEVETIGGIAAPHDVVLYRASHPHGMRCAGDGRARYVVFELHGRARLGGASRERLRLGQRLKRLAQPARAALDRVRFPG
jgi:quercetin dioxygenase-like cupin family protein